LEGLASARAAGLGYEVGGVVGKSVGIVVGGEDKWPLGLIVSFTEEALGETFGDLVPDESVPSECVTGVEVLIIAGDEIGTILGMLLTVGEPVI